MTLKRILLCCIIGFGSIISSVAQYYNNGVDPFSTNWKQINTENFQIIFPEEYEVKAQEFASKLQYAYAYVNHSMSAPARKISVIIHTQTSNSNGMVSWVPRRMELWTTPSQSAFNYSQAWMDQLILHETRHFVQENNMNQGFTRVLKVLFGEQAEMIPFGMMTRGWFLEGDAVTTETALSHSGRGRMPSFEQGIRALTLEKGVQSYDVALLGSYRYHIPNYYEVGYPVVAVNRLFRDSAMFDQKMDDIGRFKTLNGFRDSRKMKYYGFAIDYLQKEWQRQDDELSKSHYEPLLPTEKGYLSYEFLQTDSGRFYTVCTSLTQLPLIMEIDSVGHTKVVAEPGWKTENDFCVKKGKLLYADLGLDPRWENRSYADIFVKDLHSGETKKLTRKQVFQVPTFNADATKIVAEKVEETGEYQLYILEAENGKVLQKIPNPMNQFYFTPKWVDEDQKILYVAQEKDKKCLKYYDLITKKEVVLVEGTYGEMAHPVWNDGKVYFTASYSGINNIYVCDVETKEVSRVTSARFGADYATFLDGKLYYGNYTSDGYKPVKFVSSSVAGEPLADIKNMSLGLADKLTEQEGGAVDFSKVPDVTYEVKNYSRLKHLFHVHSWFPGFSSDDDNLYPCLSIMSQNKLSTSTLVATYDGNPANSDERFNVNYSYTGLYPKFSMEVSWGDFQTPTIDPRGNRGSAKVNDVIIRPSVTLPLTFKSGAYYYLFSNKVFGEFVRNDCKEIDEIRHSWDGGFYSVFSRVKQKAERDIYSPYRQQVSFIMKYNEDLDDPYKLGAIARFDIPGIAPNHSMRFALNWQKKDEAVSNVLGNLPRGFTSYKNSNLNEQIYYLSCDYTLPLFYPDVHLGGVVNVKRCAMGLYGDLALAQYDEKDKEFRGLGGSLFFDFNFLRYELDVTLGLQCGVATFALDKSNDLTYPANLILRIATL